MGDNRRIRAVLPPRAAARLGCPHLANAEVEALGVELARCPCEGVICTARAVYHAGEYVGGCITVIPIGVS